ncbi:MULTISPECIES: CaiB/BaiF CoA transferase family protein [unclassified Streptomyces]|uniref:CaiB/BaiF CoA transferase family protein n=1 Tax=unclassified Streptomyces TaxID=2593676 RepID=UPI002DD9326F|nr:MULTISPECIES: CoA transferase [unclassified Streptomyces]WRZ67904.1 CoA transferase [Streptomyces sp. NBC_01257]WSJ25797.1 CoA transferase [Streptomyces sp. NBC_01324]
MSGPLDGLLVVDLSRALAGPQAAMMFGDLGARVIKVESPSGDDSRSWGPPFVHAEDGASATESTYFLSCNRNKESITLDLKRAEDAQVLAALIRRADVLMENFKAGALGRLGFGSERLMELNPRLVVLSISGFGHDGPEAGRAGYDQIAQGEAGLMSLTGPDADHPQRIGVPIADLLAGMNGAFGVLAALRERERTGRGQIVRTSLLASVVAAHAFQGTRWTVGGEVGTAQGNHHPTIAPYGLFRCAGGNVQIACGNDAMWQRLCDAFGIHADDPRHATNRDRVAHRDSVAELLESVFADLAPDELLHRLSDAGVPAGRVRSLDEVYEWEQTRSQRLLIDVEHHGVGKMSLPGSALRMFAVDAAGSETETTRVDHCPPPVLGADADAVREWLESPQTH